MPLFDALLYVLLGVNRIRCRARSLRAGHARSESSPSPCPIAVSATPRLLGPDAAHLAALATGRPLLGGNRITPPRNGDQAYPALIHAIDAAREGVLFSTYILDNDRAGGLFREAFRRAVDRRVEVRVLIDDLGARYSWPSVLRGLDQADVRVARFLPKFVPAWSRYANLRNHRKIMVVDGRVGFTGGMSIREGCLLELNPRHPVQDLDFRVDGPSVANLQEVLAEDWAFATG